MRWCGLRSARGVAREHKSVAIHETRVDEWSRNLGLRCRGTMTDTDGAGEIRELAKELLRHAAWQQESGTGSVWDAQVRRVPPPATSGAAVVPLARPSTLQEVRAL